MKTLFISIFVLLIGSASQAQFSKATLQASGLTCSMCSNAINKSLATLPFVQKVFTDLNKNEFSIQFKPNTPVDFDQIRKKVEDAGFSVARLTVNVDVPSIAVKKDTHSNIGGLNIHFLNGENKTIDGQQTLRIVDKGFLPAKEYKKFAGMTQMKCVETGVMEACCTADKKAAARIYHVVI